MGLCSKKTDLKIKTPDSQANLLLCIIDWQKFFVDPKSPVFIPASEKVKVNLAHLLNLFHEFNALIAATRHSNSDNSPNSFLRFYGRVLSRNSVWFDLSPPIAGLKSIKIFDKETYSAFENPAFADFLVANRIRIIVLAGVQTDKCILANSLNAFDKGYQIIVIEDACCARLPEGHFFALSIIERSCGRVIKTKDLISLVKKNA